MVWDINQNKAIQTFKYSKDSVQEVKYTKTRLIAGVHNDKIYIYQIENLPNKT